MSRFLIAALYHFTPLPDFRELREAFRTRCRDLDLKGTLLVAEEGVNGTLAGGEKELRAFLAYLREDPRFKELIHKESWAEDLPFVRLKVRLKKEIVTIGIPEVDPNKEVGTYVKPRDWNGLISQPDVLLIDTRNVYETDMGSFKGAVDPETESFRDFPEWVKQNPELKPDTRVAMFCTGGIRCEKASSYMLGQGFKEVYHLEGGILKYLEEVPEEESMWQGECYVFDHRVSVDHQLQPGRYEACMACGFPVQESDKESAHYIEGVACPRCFDKTTEESKARFAERQRQVEFSRARNEPHFDVPMGRPMKDGEE